MVALSFELYYWKCSDYFYVCKGNSDTNSPLTRGLQRKTPFYFYSIIVLKAMRKRAVKQAFPLWTKQVSAYSS